MDSGVGGLTVARAIMDLLPREEIVYIGDTARSPYGPKPVEQIREAALGVADVLVHENVKLVVVACNSVEVSAIEAITDAADVPVVGVIEPGVRAALRATRSGRVGLIGTEATVASGAYDRALADAADDKAVTLRSAACPVFVEHVERGDTTSAELRRAARGYLGPLVDEGIDTLILGCTHYPLLSGLLQRELGPEVVLVSSAQETATDVYAALLDAGSQRSGPAGREPHHRFLATADPDGFGRVAKLFLGSELEEPEVGLAARPGGGAWS
jgi:glutamate racemase